MLGRQFKKLNAVAKTYDAFPIEISPVRPIQRRHVNLFSFDNPIVDDHNGADGTNNDRVATHKGKKADGTSEDFPWAQNPTANECANDLTTADVDILLSSAGSTAHR